MIGNDSHFIGMDKFILFFGIVEDRDDPLMLGRTRIRIFGLHPDDKTILPTEDLPWAFPIMPITSANVSGVGHAPIGLLVGSTVVGFFADGMERQIPMFFGTMSGGTGHFNNGDQSSPDGTSPYNGSIDGVVPSNGSITQKGASMAKIILSRYKALKPHHAAAICGNIGAESGFQVVTEGSRSNTPPDRNAKRVGYGYVQWTNSRLTAFLNWCDTNHRDPKLDATNVEYFFYEISANKYFTKIIQNMASNGVVKINKGTWAGVYDCSTPEGATTYWMAAYEAPAKGACNLDKRQKYAKDILGAMSKSGTPARAAGAAPTATN